MEKIKPEDLIKVKEEMESENWSEVEAVQITERNFETLLKEMDNPIKMQKEMAVKLKAFLDVRMEEEIRTKGYLGDLTKRWVSEYTSLLEKIQKAMFGDKSVNLHLHKISHSDIATKIREVRDGTLH